MPELIPDIPPRRLLKNSPVKMKKELSLRNDPDSVSMEDSPIRSVPRGINAKQPEKKTPRKLFRPLPPGCAEIEDFTSEAESRGSLSLSSRPGGLLSTRRSFSTRGGPLHRGSLSIVR